MTTDWHWEKHTVGPQTEFQGYVAFKDLTAINALVRESIQNAFDAKRKDKQFIVVQFRFGTATDVNRDKYLCKALTEHLYGIPFRPGLDKAHLRLYQSLRDEKTATWTKEMRYLAIEDFNTSGLDGDENETIPTPASKSSNLFRQFHHAWGESIGDDSRGGSWGFGKAVIPYSSKIKTFFALSVRDTTPDVASNNINYSLMGQTICRNHHLPHDDSLWWFYGYYGRKTSTKMLPLTSSEQGEIDAFIQAFDISSRKLKEEDRGLSAIIPYPKNEINPHNCAKEAIANYTHLINSGKLKVKIIDNDASIDWTIDSKNILNWLDPLETGYGKELGWDE